MLAVFIGTYVGIKRGRRQGHQLTRSFASRGDAEAWARLQETKIDRADLPPDRRTLRGQTLGDLLRRYATEVTPGKRSARHERNRIDRLARASIAATPLEHLRPSHLSDFRDDRLKTVGPQAVLHDLNLLAHVLRVAIQEWGVALTGNPMAQVRKPRMPHARERRLQHGELERLLAAASRDPHPDYLPRLITLAVETGMRKSELLALQWEDVDFASRLARVRVSKNGLPRSVPLSTGAANAIKAQGKTARRIFPVSVAALRFHWDRLLGQLGVRDLHFHDLRHEAVSRLFERGLSVPEVALVSGHKDPRQLFRYTHPRAEDIARRLP